MRDRQKEKRADDLREFAMMARAHINAAALDHDEAEVVERAI